MMAMKSRPMRELFLWSYAVTDFGTNRTRVIN